MAETEKVAVYEGSLSLPTYALKGENPNPVFRSQYGVAHIYPYTLLDDVASEPAEKRYRTLILENRYLRVTVLPDLGGRVYSVYDKISAREVFYKNEVVKFSPLAIRGAFFSGGVEFSFPVAHAPTTADPVNWVMQEHEDGSASIAFGGLEHISRLRWMIKLTLFPDRCALAQDVQLYNPYSLPGRYHYWTNASLDADDQTEFVYPLRRVRSYEFAGSASWPFSRLDLILEDPGLPGMEGVPMWPAERMRKPVNFRWQKNMLAQVSIFGRDVTWDFFGAWRHSVDHGYAHFANHQDVAGMKLWSWGNAGVGVVNQSALTDDGSLYAETQCGAMETQLDFAFLPPGMTRAWREWWLPLRGLGGLTCASDEAGVRLHLSPSAEEPGKLDLQVAVCPARPLGEGWVEVTASGNTLLSELARLDPEDPWQAQRRLAASELGSGPVQIRVIGPGGEKVLDYTLDREPDPALPNGADKQPSPGSAEAYYQLGLQHENFDNREQALEAYNQAIKLAPRHGEAHFRLALMLLRAADFSKAGHHFRRARLYGVIEANYYLGLLAILEGHSEIARRALEAVPAGSDLYPAAILAQGTLALQKEDWQKASERFREACSQEGKPISAGLMLGITLRRLGQEAEARKELQAVLALDPLNQPALHELALLDGEPYKSTLLRLLNDDCQYFLDLAGFYTGAGLFENALEVLDEAAQVWPYSLVFYLAAWVAEKLKRVDQAEEWRWRAAGAPPDLGFPSRLEEVLALQSALEENPLDYKARYYLGNFLYAHQRSDEGIRMWEGALPGLYDFDVLYRNLGLAAWQREKDHPKAIDLFEKALELNPRNQDLYLHLDDLYKLQGLSEKRQQLLEKVKSLPDVREDVRKRSIQMQVDLGHYQDALDIMQTEKFVPLEMDQSFHDLYVRALMQRAGDHLQAGRVEQAIGDYREAATYPENLGVGQPTTLHQAHIFYHLGLTYEQLGRFPEALSAWHIAASEHHPHGHELFQYVQMALDKLSRYSELGMEI